MGTSNAADSSRDRTSADDDALGSSHPPETRQRERDEDDGLQRDRKVDPIEWLKALPAEEMVSSRDRLSFRQTLRDRTVDPIEWLEAPPAEEMGSSRESPRYSRPTIVRSVRDPPPRSILMFAWAIGGHFVEYNRKVFGELRDYAAHVYKGDERRSLPGAMWALVGHFVEYNRKVFGELRDCAAPVSIGDERHSLPEPRRARRCASEPMMIYRGATEPVMIYSRATETGDIELQELSTADGVNAELRKRR